MDASRTSGGVQHSSSEDKYNTGEHVLGLRIIFQPEVTTDTATHKRTKKMLQGVSLANVKNLTPKAAEEKDNGGGNGDSGDNGCDKGNG